MNVNTIIGALTASAILFISSLAALFAENSDLTFATISQATWVSMAGGALVAFFKDYQAISARRLVNKITGTGDGGGDVT